jgi:bifunctional NMN adenylyltransferase/nudix hydrolase
MQNKKLGVLILRAQPLHAGHRDLIRKSRAQCDQLLILVGSANSARTIKNPYTYREREAKLFEFLEHEDIGPVFVFPLNDYIYNDAQWLSDVASIIDTNYRFNDDVIIFGHMKEGNHYLSWFPQYTFQHIDSVVDIHATGIRDDWFINARHNFAPEVLEDYDYFKSEKLRFAEYPYPETLNFNCGDAVLECAGHILLIRRVRAPGRGTWALPGGFKNNDETCFDCVIRELVEETNVRVPEKVLRGSVVASKLYDSPFRGMGIPRITMATHIRVSLNPDGTLPRISPADDALEAGWFAINTIMNDMSLFDDHSGIIQEMCGTMPLPAHKNPRFRFQN